MLILIAVIFITLAIWLGVQRVGRTKTIDWRPIAPRTEELRYRSEDAFRRPRLRIDEDEGVADMLVSDRPLSTLMPGTAAASAVNSLIGLVGIAAAPVRANLKKARAVKVAKREREYEGEVTFPHKVYEGTSKTVSVNISPGLWKRVSKGERLRVIDKYGETCFVAIVPEGPAGSQSFEVELLAAGITVEGNKKQSKKIGNEVIDFHWNCAFPTKGRYEIAVIVRLKTRGQTLDLGRPIIHRLKVVKVLGLPRHAVAVIGGLVGFVGGVIGIIDGGHKLNWW